MSTNECHVGYDRFLAVDWLQTTGLPVQSGRSERTSFGGFVYTVLNWLELGDKAEHSLRRYWEIVQSGSPELPDWIETPVISLSK